MILKSNHTKKKGSGFTLIELAIVLVIISLIGLGALKSIGGLKDNIDISKTEKNQRKIISALQNFLLNNDVLPCPARAVLQGDARYGQENTFPVAAPIPPPGTAPCLANVSAPVPGAFIGVLPHIALGLDTEDALDGWDNQFTYIVKSSTVQYTGVPVPQQNYSVSNWFLPDPAVAGSGNLNIRNTVTPAAGVLLEPNAIVILISHGPNGSGATRFAGQAVPGPIATALDELENLDNDLVFVDTVVSNAAATPYDDLVVSLNEQQLVSPLVQSGALQSKIKRANDQLDMIENATFGYIISNANDPDGPLTPAPCQCATAPVASPPVRCTGGCRIKSNAIVRPANLLPAVPASGVPVGPPLNLTLANVTDPWGTRIQYIISAASPVLVSNPAAGAGPTAGIYSNYPNLPLTVSGAVVAANSTIYTFTSFGPDGVLGNDDIIRTATRDDIIGKLAAARVPVD